MSDRETIEELKKRITELEEEVNYLNESRKRDFESWAKIVDNAQQAQFEYLKIIERLSRRK